MKLTFESNLDYQQEAIQAVVGLFEGQTNAGSSCRDGLGEDAFGQSDDWFGQTQISNCISAIGNHLQLSDVG